MSNDFLTAPEELQRATEEIAALRRELQDLSGAVQAMSAVLVRMEKRLRATFPNAQVKNAASATTATERDAPASRTREDLLQIFETLLEATRQSGDSGFLEEFDKVAPTDVGLVAFELGIPDAKRLGMKKAREAIRRRVQESLMLSPVSQRGTEKGI